MKTLLFIVGFLGALGLGLWINGQIVAYRFRKRDRL